MAEALEAPLLPGADGGGPEDDGRVEFERVLQEERACIDSLHAQREADGDSEEPGEPFSLAFSGGGIRAAAFQAGVLWRLAELNRLKDIEYFAAVSGGGYITSAFASHCLAAEPPKPGEVRSWYLDVVAKTVTRMQINAGNFVRDFVKNPGYDKDDASVLPRIFDLPILLITLCCTLLVNPVVFITVFVVPITIFVEAFYGAALRAAFCLPPSAGDFWWNIFWDFSPFAKVLRVFAVSALCTAVVFFMTKLLPCCKLTPRPGSKRPDASLAYLLGHAANAVLVRFTVGVATTIIFLVLVPTLQTYSYKDSNRLQLCSRYIERAASGNGDLMFCTDVQSSSAPMAGFWYDSPIFQNYSETAGRWEQEPVDSEDSVENEVTFIKKFLGFNVLYVFFLLWLLFMACSICIMPIIGSSLLVNTLFISGPALLLVMLMAFVQYCVFGPITQNKNGLFSYSRYKWDHFATGSLVACFILLPFYEELRSALHVYYKRCLQGNYFCNGKDHPLAAIAQSPYCPFVILTGTSSDFQPPGDCDVISELSFSGLHLGSEETGYVHTPNHASLGKCTALTGAGCLDAISLSMNDALALRFWLEVLNLSWGDYMLFQSRTNTFIHSLAEGLPFEWQGTAIRFLNRVPSGIIWILCVIWLIIAYHHTKTSASVGECNNSRELLRMVIFIILLLMGLSFFSFLPVLDWLAMSPMLRQIQQATKYFYVGRTPPGMLYVTDGGVKDCTTLVQLMRRRCKRILLVLAAADPRDELGVLRSAMAVAREEQIGSFYDPRDPRKDITTTLHAFKDDPSMPFLHLGISYCWPGENAEPGTGHLVIVKNRLPPEFQGQGIQPYISEEEVRSGGEMLGRSMDPQWESLTTDQLGPWCCCDCCHTNGLNGSPKFPHGTFTGYMYLSPQWSNSLTRLGYALSKEAVEQVTSKSPLGAQWETTL